VLNPRRLDFAGSVARAALAAAIILVIAPPARTADDLWWNNSSGGKAWASTNWTPNDVPDPDDTLIWDNLAGDHAYTVAFDATVDDSQQMRFRKSDVSLDFQDPHTTGDVFVSYAVSDDGWVSIDSGHLTASIVSVGYYDTGVLTVSGYDASLDASDLRVGRFSGDGTVNVIDGATVSVDNHVYLGYSISGPTGVVNVTGCEWDGGQFRRSTLSARTASTNTIYVADAVNAVGELHVSDGALVEADHMYVGTDQTSGTATVTVSGYSNGYPEIDLTGNLYVGSEGGTGSLTLDSLGQMTVGGTTYLGRASGNTGTLTLGNGTDLHTHAMDIQATGTLVFDGGSLFVEGGIFTDAHASRTIDDGFLYFRDGATATVYASGLTLGATDDADLYVQTGSAVTTGPTVIGDGAVYTCYADVTGEAAGVGSAWHITGHLYVGKTSRGDLDVASGGQVTVDGALYAGRTSGIHGDVTVEGATSTGTPSTLSAAGGAFIGGYYTGGSGDLEILNGGRMDVGGDMFVATGAPGDGAAATLTVSGIHAATGNPSTLRTAAGGDLVFGDYGEGTGEIADGAFVEIDSHIVVGGGGADASALSIRGVHAGGTRTEVETGDFLIAGEYSDGRIEVLDGALLTCEWIGAGDMGGCTGTLTIDGMASGYRSTVHAWGAGGWQSFVGWDATGEVTVRNGARLDQDGDTYMGTYASGDGAVTVTGTGPDGTPSVWDHDGDLWVGMGGVGAVFVRDGALAVVGTTYVGTEATSGGSGIGVDGPGTYMTVTGDLFLGGSDTAPGGDATLNINNHAVVAVGGTLKIWNTGQVNLYSGALIVGDLAGDVNPGSLYFAGGTLSVGGDLTLGPLGPLYPIQSLTPDRDLYVGGTTTIDPGCELTLDGGILATGALVDNGAFEFNSGVLALTNSGLTVGAAGLLGEEVEVTDGRMIDVAGTTDVLGGALLTVNDCTFNTGVLSNSGEVLLAGNTARIDAGTVTNTGLIRGEGRLAGDLTNAAGGELRAEDGKRLCIEGAVAANAGRLVLAGGTMEFAGPLNNAGGGDILGRGVLSAAGLSNFGDVALSNGVTDVRGDTTNEPGGRVFISGGADATFWDDVANNGALFRCSDGCTVTFFGDLTGGGVTGGGHVYLEGDLTPGGSPGAMDFGGNLTFGPMARLLAEIGGTAAGGGYDQVNVAGAVGLDGAMAVSLWGGFDPAIAGEFRVLTYGSRSGAFPEITDWRLADKAMVPDYQPDALRLFTTYYGDADLDADVDLADLSILAFHWGASGAEWRDGDFDGTGSVNLADLSALAFYWGSAVAPPAIPEPGTLSLLALAAGAVLKRRRRR